MIKFYKDKNFDIFTTTKDKLIKDKNIYFLDLENIDQSVFDNKNFEIIIFCAAYTSILECEKNPNKTILINFQNTLKIAHYFLQKNAFLIFFSTSQVFSGLNKIESIQNKTSPVTIYGKSKELLEEALSLYSKNVCILRCTKIILNNNKLFYNWVNNLKSNIEINPFNDIYFSPISLDYLLNVIDIILKERITGLYNISATNDISYKDAAFYMCNKMLLNSKLIHPISYNDINNIFIPKYTNLESNFLKMQPMPNPIEALDYFISKNL